MSELIQGLYRVTGQPDQYIPVRVDQNGGLTTSGVTSSTGVPINPEAATQTINYNVDQSVNYIQFTEAGTTYRQSFSYTEGLVTTISGWVAQ